MKMRNNKRLKKVDKLFAQKDRIKKYSSCSNMVQYRTVKQQGQNRHSRQKPVYPIKLFLLFLAKLHKFVSFKTNLLFSNQVNLLFAVYT